MTNTRRALIILVCCVIFFSMTGCLTDQQKTTAKENEIRGMEILEDYLSKTYDDYSIRSTKAVISHNDTFPTVTSCVKTSVRIDEEDYLFYIDTSTEKIYSEVNVQECQDELLKYIYKDYSLPKADTEKVRFYNSDIDAWNVIEVGTKPVLRLDDAYECVVDLVYTPGKASQSNLKKMLALNGNYTISISEAERGYAAGNDDYYKYLNWRLVAKYNDNDFSYTVENYTRVESNGIVITTNLPAKSMELKELNPLSGYEPVTNYYPDYHFTQVRLFHLSINANEGAEFNLGTTPDDMYKIFVFCDKEYDHAFINVEERGTMDLITEDHLVRSFWIKGVQDCDFTIGIYRNN